MQYLSQSISQRTRFLLELELASLEQHLFTIAFNNREYNQTILEIVGEYKIIKKTLDDRQSINQNNNNQSTDLCYLQLDQYKQMNISQQEIYESSIKQILNQFNEYKQKYETLFLAQQNRGEEVLMNCLQIQSIPQTILPDGIEQSEIFQQLHQMWFDVYQSSQKLNQTLQAFLSNRTQNNSDFLNSQRNSTKQRTRDLEILKLDFMNIQDKARRVKQFLVSEHQNQNQDNQKILSQVAKLITYNEQTIQKQLDVIQKLIEELEKQNQQTEELMQKNITLQQNIQSITQKHTKKIETLQEKFNIAIKEIIKKQNHQQISSQYKQLNKLSDLSLQIHNNFYQKIETNLSELTISFLRISIQNILGSYFSRNNDLQNKQEVINEVQRFSTTIKNLANNDISKILENAKKIFTVFERFFYSAGNDSKAQCFKKSFINSQRAIELLNQYLVSIQQGVHEFKREHDQLKKLEPKYKA